ncbi:carboxymuconolactone decarboxylase family protein [Sciscionella marina]|uniref:carboxymuconolactone decarboxylase family protein n=1 Tax=Sciscionella marina TaxID=508770 RepID=UPI0003715E42|nr:carboxymuconolactone decarboxylase family protein [Sciscionella marina]
MPQATPPRIQPLPTADMSPELRKLARLGADTVIQVLAHHPGLSQAFQPLGGFLLAQGTLDGRIRELAILRVALRCDAPYEWANHAPAALGAGATETEIEALSDAGAEWSPSDAAVLRAVDELCAEVYVCDETWAALAETRDEAQIIELLFLVGFYRMMAGFLNSAGLEMKAGQAALGAAHGSTPAFTADTAEAPSAPSGKTGPNGTWNLTFTHPAGSKALVLSLDTSGGAVTGSIFDTQMEITVPITSGTVDGTHLTLTAQVTEPAAFDISAEGSIDGDSFTGTVTITGGGTFPLTGTRAA